jgi:hypothetical protein
LPIVEGRRERRKNPDFVPGSAEWKKNREFAEYTSTSLTTRGFASWRYGRFEMRGRIDTRSGLWPAFWTLDIMEFYRGTLPANLIWSGPVKTNSFVKRKPIASFPDPEWGHKFHVWRRERIPSAALHHTQSRHRWDCRRRPVCNRISGAIRNRLRADLPKAVSSA